MCWISTCERNTQRCSPSPPSPVGPISCISWLWLMFPNRFCSPPSPPRADSSWPLPPPLPGAPGMGGLFRYSFTLRQNSSSLSVFGSWWNKAGLTTPKRSNEWILPCSMNYWVQYSAFSHYCISVFFFRHLFSSLEEDEEHLPLTCIQKNSLLDPALNFST